MTDYSKLDELGVENINQGDHHRLQYVLKSLAAAEELSNDLTWQTELWDGVTVEELLGALIESDYILGVYHEEIYDQDPDFRLRDNLRVEDTDGGSS